MNYVPILKSKRGEFLSLKELSSTNKTLVTPYIEVISESAESTFDQLSKNWNFDGNEVILDASLFFDENNDIDDFLNLIEKLESEGVNTVPAVEINSTEDYQKALKEYLSDNKKMICIRVRDRYLRPKTLISNIESVLLSLDITSNRVILLLDFGYVVASNLETSSDKAIECLDNLGDLSSYGKVIVAGGSFPENLASIAADTRKLLPRYEWQLWKTVKDEFDSDQLCYGDYGIKHPILDTSVSMFQGTCSVKYTTETSFMILRGIKPGNHRLGGGQYHEKCQQLVTDGLYDGDSFSWGDNEILECSRRSKNPGNAETWVKIGHNHHITKILSLL